MKTKEEILKFYGVEVEKKYIITKVEKNYNSNIKSGYTFVVTPKLMIHINEKLYSLFTDINFLNHIDYKEMTNILDDVEKKYLSAVIKPFSNNVKGIIKETNYAFKNRAYIHIELLNGDDAYLPTFEKDKMYKGMELDKRYTLEELGL